MSLIFPIVSLADDALDEVNGCYKILYEEAVLAVLISS